MNKRPLTEDDNQIINKNEPQPENNNNDTPEHNNKKLKSIDSFEQLKECDEDEDIDVEIDTKLINKLDRKGKKYEFIGEDYTDEEQSDSDKSYSNSNSNSSSEYEYDYENEEELLDDDDHLDNINEIKKIQQKTTTTTTSTTTSSAIIEREEEEDDEEENIELVARSFMYKHIQEKISLGIEPLEFTKEIGFKLVLDKEDDAWEIITAFLTRKKVAVNLFLNYLKFNSLSRPYRKKIPTLEHLSTSFDSVVELFRKSKNIVIVTGAGVSVSCGIPDFRSKGGVYETIEKKYNLPRPESLFDIHYLRQNPLPFFEFAKEIFPGTHKPSPTHYFIKKLDEVGKLLRNYTQNIDTLEHLVGINSDKLVNCHGSFSTATCITCKLQVDGQSIRDEIMKMEIPYCKQCNDSKSFMKPDIVFFGENLPDRFDQCVVQDIKNIDLLIVMGSSLQVQPVSLIPELIDKDIPQILINRELVAQPHEFDYVYLGDCDQFVKELLNKINDSW